VNFAGELRKKFGLGGIDSLTRSALTVKTTFQFVIPNRLQPVRESASSGQNRFPSDSLTPRSRAVNRVQEENFSGCTTTAPFASRAVELRRLQLYRLYPQ
jgi:hypothetical protein